MTEPGWLDHVLALLVGVLLPLSAMLQARGESAPVPLDTRDKIRLYLGNGITMWLLAGITAWIWLGAGRSLSDLGFRAVHPELVALVWTLCGGYLLLYVGDATFQLATPERRARTRSRWRRDTPFMPANGREVAWSLIMVVSAAVCEEILFRGFLIRYLSSFTGWEMPGVAVAVAAPALVFGLSHLYQGPLAVVKIVILAAWYGVIYLLGGSLWPVIALHFVTDLIGSFLGPFLLGGASLSSREPEGQSISPDGEEKG